jgi:hypothetical protein
LLKPAATSSATSRSRRVSTPRAASPGRRGLPAPSVPMPEPEAGITGCEEAIATSLQPQVGCPTLAVGHRRHSVPPGGKRYARPARRSVRNPITTTPPASVPCGSPRRRHDLSRSSTATAALLSGAPSCEGPRPQPPSIIGHPTPIAPTAVSIALSEGWLWEANGADHGLVCVRLGTAESSIRTTPARAPWSSRCDLGVWTAHATGKLTRFNPLPYQLRLNGDVTLPAKLDSIAATERSPFVWAISTIAMTLYRVTKTSTSSLTGTVVFPSPPIALAPAERAVWIAPQRGKSSRSASDGDEVRLLQHRPRQRRDRAFANPRTPRDQPAWRPPHVFFCGGLRGHGLLIVGGHAAFTKVCARRTESRRLGTGLRPLGVRRGWAVALRASTPAGLVGR